MRTYDSERRPVALANARLAVHNYHRGLRVAHALVVVRVLAVVVRERKCGRVLVVGVHVEQEESWIVADEQTSEGNIFVHLVYASQLNMLGRFPSLAEHCLQVPEITRISYQDSDLKAF